MEPRREEQPKALGPNAEPKTKRFRIVKLEERIAPARGGKGSHNGCYSDTCGPSCWSCHIDCW